MRAVRLIRVLGRLALVVLAAGMAPAATPDAASIAARVRRALEPARSSLRKTTLVMRDQSGTSELKLGEARGTLGDSRYIVVVVLAPAELRGTAFLIQRETEGPKDEMWVYLPSIQRIRRLVSPEAYSAFLNSDFTYSDLSFVSTQDTLTLVNDEVIDDTRALRTEARPKGVYRLEAVPASTWYYSKIVTTVSASSDLPTERQYFDAAGRLWKVERWSAESVVDGIPTALEVSMEDVQTKGSSTLTVTDLRYGADVPNALLDWSRLPEAALSPVWSKLDAPVKR